jgi:hypothetical protein
VELLDPPLLPLEPHPASARPPTTARTAAVLIRVRLMSVSLQVFHHFEW